MKLVEGGDYDRQVEGSRCGHRSLETEDLLKKRGYLRWFFCGVLYRMLFGARRVSWYDESLAAVTSQDFDQLETHPAMSLCLENDVVEGCLSIDSGRFVAE